MFGIGKKKDEAAAPVEPWMASTDASMAPAAAAVEMQPAGFWLRVVALVLDYGVLLILLAVMMTAAEGVGGEDLAAPVYWLWVLVTFLYWPLLESTAGRGTLGKMALGLVVGDVDGGGLSFVRSLLRNLAKIISSIPFGIGFLMAAFTSRKQALHDLITKAIVMRKGPGSFVRAIGVLVAGIALIVASSYLTSERMMGAFMKDMEAMMAGGVAQPPAKPQSKAPAKPPAIAKPAAPAPSAQPPATAGKPAPDATPAPTATAPSAAAPATPAPTATAPSAAAPAAAAPAASAPAPQASAPAQPPVAKPVAPPVQVAQAPAAAKPAPATKPVAPAPQPATAVAEAPAAKPALATKPAAPTSQPATAVAAAPAAKPEPAMAAAAPKAPEPMEAKPAPTPPGPRPQAEPLVPLSRLSIPVQPSPRFNDIMTAVIYRDRETVTQLLSLGRWPDKRDSNRLTPLMVAAGNGDAAMVRLLLEGGARPDLQAPGGATALDFALERGDATTTQLLQQRRVPR